MIFFANNNKGNSIDIKNVVTIMDEDREAFYYLQILTTSGTKIKWEYPSKQIRDSDLKELRELRDKQK